MEELPQVDLCLKWKNILIKSVNVLEQEFRNEIYPVSSKLEIVDAYGKTHYTRGGTGLIIPIPLLTRKVEKLF